MVNALATLFERRREPAHDGLAARGGRTPLLADAPRSSAGPYGTASVVVVVDCTSTDRPPKPASNPVSLEMDQVNV
jgi:hypothetical protein